MTVKAEFSASVTFAPAGGGVLTQAFNVAAPYGSVSTGTIALAAGTEPAAIAIPFGGVSADAKGLVLRNNTPVDLGIRLNGAAADHYHLAPGGLLMHWAPAAAATAASALKALSVMPAAKPAEDGTIDYLVFGA
jgi:hypothetical protein